MKKAVCLLMCLILFVGLVGCKEKREPLPDLADCEIGYEFEVYPKVPFSYAVKPTSSNRLKEDLTIHIESIAATLTAKNEIKEGDVLTDPYRPYVVSVVVKGRADNASSFDRNEVELNIHLALILSIISPKIVFDADGSFECVFNVFPRENCVMIFSSVR